MGGRQGELIQRNSLGASTITERERQAELTSYIAMNGVGPPVVDVLALESDRNAADRRLFVSGKNSAGHPSVQARQWGELADSVERWREVPDQAEFFEAESGQGFRRKLDEPLGGCPGGFPAGLLNDEVQVSRPLSRLKCDLLPSV